MPPQFSQLELPKPFSQLGLDADGQRGDLAFYRWLKIEDDLNQGAESLDQFTRAILDELKDAPVEELRAVLDDWQTRLTKEEMSERLVIFGKLVPETHLFHRMKKNYL